MAEDGNPRTDSPAPGRRGNISGTGGLRVRANRLAGRTLSSNDLTILGAVIGAVVVVALVAILAGVFASPHGTTTGTKADQVGQGLPARVAARKPADVLSVLQARPFPDSDLPSGYFSAGTTPQAATSSSAEIGRMLISPQSQVGITGTITYLVYPDASTAAAQFDLFRRQAQTPATPASLTRAVGQAATTPVSSPAATGGNALSNPPGFAVPVTLVQQGNTRASCTVQVSNVLIVAFTSSQGQATITPATAAVDLARAGVVHLDRVVGA